MASRTRKGCRVCNMRRSRGRTERDPTYSSRNIAPRNHPAAEKVHRQEISASGITGLRKIRRKPSAVGETRDIPKVILAFLEDPNPHPVPTNAPKGGHPLCWGCVFPRVVG